MTLRRPSHPFHTPSRTPPSRTPSRTPAATLAAASVRRGRALAAAAALPAAAALRRRPASPSTPPLPLGPPSARPLPAAALDDDAPVSALALAAATLAVSSLATSASPEERVAIRINIIIYRLVLRTAWRRRRLGLEKTFLPQALQGLHPFSIDVGYLQYNTVLTQAAGACSQLSSPVLASPSG